MTSVRAWLAPGLFAAAGVLAAHLGVASGLDRSILDRSVSFNRQHALLPAPLAPVLVGIDEAFVESVDEPLTLIHVHLARFLDAMALAGPSVVGIDLALPEKSFDSLALKTRPGVDLHRVLTEALLKTSAIVPVIVAKVWDGERVGFRNIHVDYATALSLHERPFDAHASTIFCSDPDGPIRRYPGSDCQPAGSEASFSGEMSAAAGRRQPWSGLINYQVGAPLSYVPLQQVLTLEARSDTAALQHLFQGRMVLLGTVLDDVDLLELPVAIAAWRPGVTRLPGVIAHAQALRTMLNQGFIQPAPQVVVLGVTALFGLFWFRQSVVAKLLVLAIAAAGLLWLSSRLLLGNVWLPPAAALITGLAATSGRAALESWRTLRDKRRLTRAFSGYVSPAVMREIVTGGLDGHTKGVEVPICVLFSDIRGFTTLSEQMSPEEVVALLNRYFGRMTQVVHRHEGTVDKFIGDGLMAFFGAPNALPSPAHSAFAAAQEMLVSLAALNVELVAEGRPALAIGIGLHAGPAVVGNMGSAERNAYTAIGDTVNTASRLESLCKELGYPLLCSQSVADAVAGTHRTDALGKQALKGHSPMNVFGWRAGAGQQAAQPASAAQIERKENADIV